jgi:alanyl-tRNA synthetase
MVTMGPSKELCGGTHVGATGELGLFTFASEGSVASGVRRVEAFASGPALESVQAIRALLARAADELRTSPDDVPRKLDELQEETRRLKRRLEELEKAAVGDVAAELARRARDVAGHRLIAGRAAVQSRDALRDLGDELRASGPRTVVVLGTEMEGKVALVAAVSDDLVRGGRVRAGDLVGRVARIAGGGGGGKPHLATAGAKDPARLDDALDAVAAILAELAG